MQLTIVCLQSCEIVYSSAERNTGCVVILQKYSKLFLCGHVFDLFLQKSDL